MTQDQTAAPNAAPADRLISDEVVARQRNRQVMVMTGVILVLAGLVWLSRSTRAPEEKLTPVPLVGGTADAPAFAAADVAQIEIWAGSDKPLVLVRQDGGWRVPVRFGAPADRNDVDALLTKLFDSKRLGRPSTEDETRYAQYGLADADAVHLRLQSAAGKELLHLLLGQSDDRARDFVRLLGNHPKGIFELAGPGGAWDTLYSRLQLNADGRPDPKRWLDLSGFRVIDSGTRVDRVVVTDGDREFEFRHDPVDENKWQVTRPRQGEGEAPAIKGVISVLENLAASDIAGRDTDAHTLGIAASRRSVMLEYLVDSRPVQATVTFGERKDGMVAVLLKSNNQGSLIHWVGDYVLDRVFRKPGEFIRRAEVNLVPLMADIDRLRVTDGDKLIEARKEAAPGATLKEWKLITPPAARADRGLISGLVNELNTLRGLKHTEAADFVALGVDPSVCRRWLEVFWQEKPERKEGEPEPEPVQKTAALYFGKVEHGEIAVLVRASGRDDAVFWLDEEVTRELFMDPAELVAMVRVRHILVSWKDKAEGLVPKDPERTEEQARALVARIMERIRSGEDFVELQKEFNEDRDPVAVYDVTRQSQLVPSFKELSLRLAVNGFDQVDSPYGVHIIKRIE